jgi:hypothetical protein
MQEVSASPAALRALAYRWPERYPLLLDSAAVSGQGAWSILAARAGPALHADGHGRLRGEGMQPQGRSFLEALERWWRELALPPGGAPALPFTGGWAVYLPRARRRGQPTLTLPGGRPRQRARTPAGWVRSPLRSAAWSPKRATKPCASNCW